MTQKITLSSSRDIPLNKLVLSQSNVRRVKSRSSVMISAAGLNAFGKSRMLRTVAARNE